MQRLLVTIALGLAISALPGCAVIQDINPFTSRPASTSETTYGQFANIPVPSVMTAVPRRSNILLAPDGAKSGLETFEGNVSLPELTRVMPAYMMRDGWAVRLDMIGGGRTMQVFEHGNLCAVIYYHRQTATTAMEIWLGAKLADGAWQPPAAPPVYTPESDGHNAGGMNTAPLSPPAPTANTGGSSGLQERNLP